MVTKLSAPYPHNIVDLVNLEVLTQEELEAQRKIVTLRRYFGGDQGSKVTDRLKEFMPSLSKGFTFTLNVTAIVVEAVTEYLNIKNWDSEDEPFVEWCEDLWARNKMPSKQDDVHENALVDGEAFLIVSWDNEELRPRWTPAVAYTSNEAGGDGAGCRVFYPEDDVNQKPLYALKRWSDTDERGQRIDFKTLYYPDRIEKYYRDNDVQWKQRRVEGEEWPAPWVDTAGNPLGVPVIHFMNKRGRSEVEDILAIQDSVNKSALDTLITSDQTAFRIYVALGWIPTQDGKPPAEDGSNWAEIEPGKVFGTTEKDAKFQVVEPPKESIEGQSNLTQQFLVWAAIMSDTPATRVITTKLIASDETLKQQEKPLENKVANRRDVFTPAWIQVIEMSRALENVYGELTLNEESKISPIWGSRLKESTQELEPLKMKQDLGVPQRQIWREMGYSIRKIKQMEQMIAESRPENPESDNSNEQEEQNNDRRDTE